MLKKVVIRCVRVKKTVKEKRPELFFIPSLIYYFCFPCRPVYSSFGVAVDFAGHPTDNPLYSSGNRNKKNPFVNPYEASFADVPGYYADSFPPQGSYNSGKTAFV